MEELKRPNRKLPRWDILFPDGTFPSAGFGPSDVDGIMERAGHFVLMEWKRRNERRLKFGQRRLLLEMSKLRHPSGRLGGEIWLIRGTAWAAKPDVVAIATCVDGVWSRTNGDSRPTGVACDVHGLRRLARDFYDRPEPDPGRLARVLS